MIASRSERLLRLRPASRRRTGVALLALMIGVSACASESPPPEDSLLLPLSLPARFNPSEADRAAARMAAAALASDRGALRREALVLGRLEGGGSADRLGPLCADLENASLDDEDAYRAASRELLHAVRDDPALEARIERVLADDPLKLARRRSLDGWERLWARTFNAVSEPLGRSLFSGLVTAPLTLASSAAHYLADFTNDEPLSLTDRQALALRESYLAHHAAGPQRHAVEGQVERAELRLARTLRLRREHAAERALEAGSPRRALFEAERALHWGPSTDAERIRERARAAIHRDREQFARSLVASRRAPPHEGDANAAAFASALLASEPLAPRLLNRFEGSESGVSEDEAGYVAAMAQYEAGFEEAGWRRLREIAARDPARSSMARHARALVVDDSHNPWRSFVELRRRQRWARIRWRLFGNWSRATRYPNLPRSVGYLIDAPAVAQTLLTAPLRLIFGRWRKGPDFERPVALAAYRYLGLHPEGEHARDLLGWLLRYEQKRDHAMAALRIADFIPGLAPDERNALLEKAAEQALKGASRAPRGDGRGVMLRQVVREFPDTQAGHEAGRRARAEAEALADAPQSIRVTRGFLEENPRVAGRDGLGLNPLLLNGEIDDGELHPNGVTFLGGRRLRVDLVDAGGDEDAPPHSVEDRISDERLGRVSAILDETARRNELIDPDEQLAADAGRDRFLERARLGLTERTDRRAGARSTYVYRSMRERYGMVRGRESILPFDLVLQGSLQDLSLGAFPRWRAPKRTPDAFLYR